MSAEVRPNIYAVIDWELSVYGHNPDGNHAVNMAVYCRNFVGGIKAGDEELPSELVGCVAFNVLGVA